MKWSFIGVLGFIVLRRSLSGTGAQVGRNYANYKWSRNCVIEKIIKFGCSKKKFKCQMLDSDFSVNEIGTC